MNMDANELRVQSAIVYVTALLQEMVGPLLRDECPDCGSPVVWKVDSTGAPEWWCTRQRKECGFFAAVDDIVYPVDCGDDDLLTRRVAQLRLLRSLAEQREDCRYVIEKYDMAIALLVLGKTRR